ncbi:phosphoglycerate dehydrogenase [Candidatus Thioglobus sp. NP1]|uniref:phosphoglycerate dehydrogenase n=1 Tax=Candidatus Thioglobus sp. NP1 TaxID=2508687 RepID=UPI000DEDCA1F|nr:phosphoglycerate dehydrogenase [Candidatus Thioglobus sp. NP1]AXE61701.1 phosphoglycerate dehydrogenase [Candidatus Thioglobus sp. NP1]
MKSLAITSRSFSKHPILRNEVLKRYPNAKFNDQGLALKGKSLVKFLQGYEKAITALEKIDEELLSELPELKVIGKYGVGLDMLDLSAMKKYGVKLGWKGGVNKRSVSELVVSFAIYLLHRVVFANAEVRNGEWYQVKGRQLSDCTVGIIGCGHIGKDLVKLLKPFNCNILVNDILNFKDFYQENNITPVRIEELMQKSDIVTLHLPLNSSTENIISRDRLQMLKKDAIFINLARGGLLDEDALKKLLRENQIAGAALDVFAIEPPSDTEFALMDNVIVTPHIGGSSEEAILAMGIAAIDGLDSAKDPMTFLHK